MAHVASIQSIDHGRNMIEHTLENSENSASQINIVPLNPDFSKWKTLQESEYLDGIEALNSHAASLPDE